MNRLTLASAVIVVGAMVGVAEAKDEVIIIVGCDPGKVAIGEGTNTVCIDPDNPFGGGGPGPRPGTNNPNGNDGGGGGGGGDPDDPGEDRDMTGLACQDEGVRCAEAARLARSICERNAKATAARHCDATAAGGIFGTRTPWGSGLEQRSIGDLGGGRKTGEPLWDRRDWSFGCRNTRVVPLAPSVRTCTGPGVVACNEAWAASHPGVTTTNTTGITTTLGGTATLPPVGLSSTVGQTTTNGTSYTLSPVVGWQVGCQNVQDAYTAQCAAAEMACYVKNRCYNYQPD